MRWKLWPTRSSQVVQDFDVVSDLDELRRTPVAFRFMGRLWIIKPFTTEQFFQFNQSCNELDRLSKQKDVSSKDKLLDEWVTAYHKVFRIACPELERKHVEQMNTQQLGALYQLIFDCVTGKAHADAEKKKIPLPKETPSASV